MQVKQLAQTVLFSGNSCRQAAELAMETQNVEWDSVTDLNVFVEQSATKGAAGSSLEFVIVIIINGHQEAGRRPLFPSEVDNFNMNRAY